MTARLAPPMPPAVWFAYSASRGGEHPQSHLKNFTGILQADAFAGYDAIYASGRVKKAAVHGACAQEIPRSARSAPD
jgi:hypothetical protein